MPDTKPPGEEKMGELIPTQVESPDQATLSVSAEILSRWKLSEETLAAMKAIDANIRAAEHESGKMVFGGLR